MKMADKTKNRKAVFVDKTRSLEDKLLRLVKYKKDSGAYD